MHRSGFAPLLILLMAFQSCSTEPAVRMELHRDSGRITLFTPEADSLCIRMRLNGEHILVNGFLFHEKDRAVVIGSRKGLDLVTSFREEAQGTRITLTLVNTTEERWDVQGFKITAEWPHTEKEWPRVRPVSEGEAGWRWITDRDPQTGGFMLDLSGSALVLLPEEQVTLPAIQVLFQPVHVAYSP